MIDKSSGREQGKISIANQAKSSMFNKRRDSVLQELCTEKLGQILWVYVAVQISGLICKRTGYIFFWSLAVFEQNKFCRILQWSWVPPAPCTHFSEMAGLLWRIWGAKCPSNPAVLSRALIYQVSCSKMKGKSPEKREHRTAVTIRDVNQMIMKMINAYYHLAQLTPIPMGMDIHWRTPHLTARQGSSAW